MDGFQVMAAVTMGDKSGTYWVHGQSVPSNAGATIAQMVLVGDILHVLTQSSSPPVSGGHIRLSPPLVMFVVESAPIDTWREVMRETDGRTFSSMVDGLGKLWKVNDPVPGDTSTIVKIVGDQFGNVFVFASPAPNSEWSKHGVAFCFTHMAMTGHIEMSDSIPMDKWEQLREELSDEAEQFGMDDDDPDDDEESEDGLEVVPTAAEIAGLPAAPPPPAPQAPAPSFMPAPPPAPATPNGSAA